MMTQLHDIGSRTVRTERAAAYPRVRLWVGYAAGAWALLYAAYRGYYALGGTVGMFGTPTSMSQWRLINAVAAVLLVIAAVLPVATARLWHRRHARMALLALCWVIAVGCVMHALVDVIVRLLSIAGVLHMEFPYFASIDRRAADLQDLFFNEPWFLGEGMLWGILGWMELTSTRSRRWWLASGLAGTAALTLLGLLSAAGLIGKIIVG